MCEEKQIRFLPAIQTSGKTKYGFYLFDKHEAKGVTQRGRCIIAEAIEKLKEAGFDSGLKTKYERFGDTILPVTYGPNGLVIVDYPNKPLK